MREDNLHKTPLLYNDGMFEVENFYEIFFGVGRDREGRDNNMRNSLRIANVTLRMIIYKLTKSYSDNYCYSLQAASAGL